MWSKFKSFPLTVRMAAVFLSIVVMVGVVAMPHILIPLLLIVFTVASLIRIFVFLVHNE